MYAYAAVWIQTHSKQKFSVEILREGFSNVYGHMVHIGTSHELILSQSLRPSSAGTFAH